MSNGAQAGQPKNDCQQLGEDLSSEYKIVQDKIDKIGAFRFTIRGWTITLVTGVILTVATAKFLSPYAPLFLLALILMFALIERKQNRNQEILEDRAFEIEAIFRRTRQAVSDARAPEVMSPWIAHALNDANPQEGNAIRRFLGESDRWFYWALALFVCAVVAFLVFLGPTNDSDKQQINVNINNAQESHSETPSQPTSKKKKSHQ